MRTLALLAAVALAAGAPHGRDQPAGPGRLVRVTGVVYDSLASATLAGAVVTRDGAPGVALTDSTGRFALDSVPAAPGRFVVSHPALDSAGLADVPVAVDLTAAGDSTAVRLATPSRATLAGRLCPGAPGGAGGVVFGVVRDALDSLGAAPPAGAEATVAWVAVRDGRGALRVPRPESRAAPADSGGTWAACGLPLGAPLEVRAAAGPRASGRAAVTLGPRGVARVDLWLGAAAGGTAAPAVIAGLVRDSAGVPFAGARVVVDEVDGVEARTDAAGRFRLAGLPAGTRTLLVRAVGYPPAVVAVALRAGATAEAEVTLRRVVTLSPVTVRTRAPRLDRLAADLERRRQNPRGYFADTAVVHASGARFALAGLPVGSVGGDDNVWAVGFAQRTRSMAGRLGSCTASVWIDGAPSAWRWVPWLDQRRIAAIEVYQDGRLAPAEFANDRCGVVLFWTDAVR